MLRWFRVRVVRVGLWRCGVCTSYVDPLNPYPPPDLRALGFRVQGCRVGDAGIYIEGFSVLGLGI